MKTLTFLFTLLVHASSRKLLNWLGRNVVPKISSMLKVYKMEVYLLPLVKCMGIP